MRARGPVTLTFVCLVSALSLAACGGGGGDGYGCQGRTCTASFQGPGEQDLSQELGSDATVRVETVDGESVTAKISGRDAKLVKDEPRRVAGYVVTLTEVDGEDVTVRVVGE